jgi:putative Mg2+ transporter-C (MgtC) family protein
LHLIYEGGQGVTLTLSGAKITNARDVFAEVAGVIAVLQAEDEPD